jgi:general secretion pathway protein D
MKGKSLPNLRISRLIPLCSLTCAIGFAQGMPLANGPNGPNSNKSPGQPGERIATMHLRGNPNEVVRQALALYGIDVLFAPPMRGDFAAIRFDLGDADLRAAVRALTEMTHLMFLPLGPRMVLAYTDDLEHPELYLRSATADIPVANLAGEQSANRLELRGLLSTIFDITKADVKEYSVLAQGPPDMVAAAEQLLNHLFRPQAEVLLEVKVYQVERTHDRDVGVKTPSKFLIFNVSSEAEQLIDSNSSVVQELISAGLVSASNTLGIAELLIAEGYTSGSVLGSSSLYFGGGKTATGVQFDSASANASLSETRTQELRNTKLQILDGQTGILKIGERYPILISSTSAVTSSGSSSKTGTVPSVQYEDIGLTLEVKPRVEENDEVVLQMREVIRTLHGASSSDPVFDNIEYSSTIAVPAGSTTVIVGATASTRKIVRQGLIPGTPTDAQKGTDDSQLLVTITPVIRRYGESK